MSDRDEISLADLDEAQTAFQIVGHGPPLLLIHGAEADHAMFRALVVELAPYHTVIAYDQRDCGQTRNSSRPYDAGDLARDAAHLVEHLGFERSHVFGTSLGGTIAQSLASRFPSRVDRLMLASTWRAGDRLADFNPRVAQELARLRSDVRANAPRIAAYFFTPSFIDTHPEVIEIFRSASRTDAQRARRAHMQAHPCRAELGAIASPTLLLAGAVDRLIPAGITFSLAREIGNAECTLMDAIPHVGAIEAPARLAEMILRFTGRRPDVNIA